MDIEAGLLKSLERAELSFCDDSLSFLQSGYWGAFKTRFGWEALAFRADWNGEHKSLLVLRRPLAPGFSLAYITWGPELPDGLANQEKALNELACSLKNKLPKDTAFIRFDLPYMFAGSERSALLKASFIRSVSDVQAPDSVIIDLSKSLEELKAEMKPKWRYNAKLAEKKGVSVYRAGAEKLDAFYELLKETALRDKISVHSKEYYKVLFEGSWYQGKKPDIRLYLAEHEGELLAAIMTLFRGKEAVYLYGASSNKKRNLMAPYALQLKAIEDAKNSHCLEYDLYGIPPDENPNNPMAGLYLFKTGFGGKIIHRYGCWDYPLSPFIYKAFRCAEKFRKALLKIRKQR